MAVLYSWAGAPTTSSIRVVGVLDAPATTVRVRVSTDSSFASGVVTSAGVAPDADLAYRTGDITGLVPDTRYYYQAEIDGVPDPNSLRTARTLPARRQKTSITFGSCWAATGQQYHGKVENHPVGAAITLPHVQGKAVMHLFCGDMGYLDNEINDPNPWKDNFAKLHAMGYFASFATWCTLTAIWDDHDFGGNDSNSTFARKDQAASCWRQFVPTYEPVEASGPMYHAFDLLPGVRVVMSDLRFNRDPDKGDNLGKTMMGANQKAWLKQEWLNAKLAGKLIIWVTSSMWGIDGSQGSAPGTNKDGDGWWAFASERNELDEFRSVNGIKDMVILTGDGHQISYRTNVDYSSAQDIPTPVYAVAAYSRAAAYRPAAWNATSTDSNCDGHYGVLTLDPKPGGWQVTCEFHTVDSGTSVDTIEFTASQFIGDMDFYGVGEDQLGVSDGGIMKYVGQPG